MKNEYQDIFMKIAEKSKKKGTSLASVLKLIQELAEFEANIQEAADAQEISENRTKIEGFLGILDNMYDELFSMARGGIGEIRNTRSRVEEGEVDEVENRSEKVVREEPESNPPVRLNVPSIPKM